MFYCIECVIQNQDLAARKEFYVVRPESCEPTPFKKEIGLTNVLHMEVCLKSNIVDPRQEFIGCVYFLLAKIRIVSVAIELIRREEMGAEAFETSSQAFEILDGAPVRGVLIPIRFYLGELGIWPAPRDAKVAVSYSLGVVGTDDAGNLYKKRIPVRFAFKK